MSENRPRLTIGAATSGTGKTLFSTLLGKILTKQGNRVQPFKCGPDYIDPSYHSLACRRISRNLDTRLISRQKILELFERHASDADLSLIEGVMGLYDGSDGLDERGSTAHLAKMLDSPAVLLLDVKAMARSAGAIALGYRDFDRDLALKGFILNRVASPRHERMVRQAVEDATGLPVLGAIPKNKALVMPERHLGLIPAWEKDEILDFFERTSCIIRDSVDIEKLREIARSAPPLPGYTPSLYTGETKKEKHVRIAYAWDRAFHFYYQDNLDFLSSRGADLVPFSPLKDNALPHGTEGIYLGGGYPELYGDELEQNISMRQAVLDASGKGMPLWGECGGLMYLTKSITGFDGKAFQMAGVFPATTVMKKGLRALGYYKGTTKRNSWIGPEGEEITGHIFHWSSIEEKHPALPYMMELEKEGDPEVKGMQDGFYRDRTWASYMHMHLASHPEIADRFIQACRDYTKTSEGKN